MATSFNTLRVSFLEQAAKLMNEHSADVADSYATLSRIYIKELREVCNVEQIRMHKDFKRTGKVLFTNLIIGLTNSLPH